MPNEPGKGKGAKGLAALPDAPGMDWWAQGAEDSRGTPGPPPRAPGVRQQGPPKVYRTLGRLRSSNLQGFLYFEHKFLIWVHEILTRHWGTVQGGTSERALHLWQEIFMTLELDRKAQGDLMLLAHEGLVGRSEANEILWELLSVWALKPEYEDLSHKVTNMVYIARKNLDRPPRTTRTAAGGGGRSTGSLATPSGGQQQCLRARNGP